MKKIVFICGSMEPGKDGVGDYVRRLSFGIVKLGYHVSVIAIYDNHISTIRSDQQKLDGELLPVMRLPVSLKEASRNHHLKRFVNQMNPEWLSLQYVPFAYQDKGLPYRLGDTLKRISKNRLWHIMFHELWVGMEMDAPAKYKWWERLQKTLIYSLIRKLKPKVIHTQAQVYKAALNKLGFEVSRQTYFGESNIAAMKEIFSPNRVSEMSEINNNL